MKQNKQGVQGISDSGQISCNLKHRVFFHGTESAADVASIARHGFKREYIDQDGRWFRDGNLGIGTYLSCNWRTALWFGGKLIQATVLPGTRILDASDSPNQKVLSSLRREFGHELLTAIDPRKVLPRNKSLTLEEFATLLRHHYHQTFSRTAQDSWQYRFSQPALQHGRALHRYAALLPRYQYHGYGHPADDNGILIFQPERIRFERVVLDIPDKEHGKIADVATLSRIRFVELKRKYGTGEPFDPHCLALGRC